MHFKELHRGELMAVAGAVLLIISLFLSWYDLGNQHTVLGHCQGPTGCTGWKALTIARYLFLLAALSPLVLAYVVLRGHGLSWPRGEMTAVVAVFTIALAVFVGWADKPGNPRSEINVGLGWILAMVAGVLMFVGAVWRTQESGGQRKPPGVL